MKNLCVVVVFCWVVLSAAGGQADTSSGDLPGGQNHHFTFVDSGPSGPYVDETVTIDLFWNKVAMFMFDAEKEAGAILRITRLTPDRTISRGFVGIDKDLYRLDEFLSGPDTVFVRDVRLGKNNHVFVHVFGDPGASLLVQVLPPLPTIRNFTVSPDRVPAGQGAVLTWSTLQAETVTIEPGIGQTASEGTLAVTPETTTLYRLTAANSYGSTSTSARLEVLGLPQVSITADPEAIADGGSARLAWTSTDADTCYIEPDVGAVNTSGSVVVSPVATTTYTITATGPGGTATDRVTVQVDCPLSIAITSPADGAFITRPDILVTGIIGNAANRATAVSVNDIVAVVHGNQFVVNHMPLEDGENTITVTAEDATGCSQTVTRQVYADTSGHYIDITATLESGLPVFASDLYLSASFPVVSSAVEVSGPDTIILTQEEADEYNLEVLGEGFYILTAEADYDGLTYRDEIAITGLNRDAVDAQVKAVWDKMKVLLINNNREKALELIHPVVQDHQRQVFDILGDDLPGIISAMRDIRLVTVENNQAEYRVERERMIQGQPYDITYYIIFSRTGQGWRIVNF